MSPWVGGRKQGREKLKGVGPTRGLHSCWGQSGESRPVTQPPCRGGPPRREAGEEEAASPGRAWLRGDEPPAAWKTWFPVKDLFCSWWPAGPFLKRPPGASTGACSSLQNRIAKRSAHFRSHPPARALPSAWRRMRPEAKAVPGRVLVPLPLLSSRPGLN